MPRSYQSYLDLISHAVGPTPATGFVALDVLNDAGNALFGERKWSWRKSRPTAVQAVAAQEWSALPADFGELCEAVVNNTVTGGSFTRVQIVELDEILRMRQRNFTQTAFGTVYAAFDSWTTQAVPNAEPVPRVYWYPTPTVINDPTIEIVYWRRWAPATGGGLGNCPDMPREAEHALAMLARAMAEHLEHQQEALEDKAYQAALDRLKKLDGGRTPQAGRFRPNLRRRGAAQESVDFGTTFSNP